MMEIFKKYSIVIAVFLTVMILILIRLFCSTHFKEDAKKRAEPSIEHSNIISSESLETLAGDKLILCIDEGNPEYPGTGISYLKIPADSILIKSNLSVINNHDGPVLISSADPAISARIWMILSQLGINKLMIVAEDTGNEVLKYKFLPDTLVRQEL